MYVVVWEPTTLHSPPWTEKCHHRGNEQKQQELGHFKMALRHIQSVWGGILSVSSRLTVSTQKVWGGMLSAYNRYTVGMGWYTDGVGWDTVGPQSVYGRYGVGHRRYTAAMQSVWGGMPPVYD